jgi:Family of unknown function (DUF5681)
MSARSEGELRGCLDKTGAANKYEIGYGRPPQHSRFRKGQSGNPTGRRRYTESERGKQLLRQEAGRLVTVREGDKVVRVSALQAVLRSVFYTAAKGNTSAQKMILNVLKDTADAEPQNAAANYVKWLGQQVGHLTDKELETMETILEAGEKRSREAEGRGSQ